ncbi:pseudouridine synthase [Chaetomium strumarium]|uniref:Pseudouridine synthase n=1 Tax=Chaetomium strumarium TaxID=1170767 RepID=A0AAJ0GL48_9PEZI|nr:pseudouridine synthase [Chaetomium strumarium]
MSSQRPGTHVPAVRVEAERALGISQRSAAINFSWTGDIRKRYTDFLVNEIRKDGTVLHLRDYEEQTEASASSVDRNPSAANLRPENKPKVHSITQDDRTILVVLIGENTTQKLIDLDEKVQNKVQLGPDERTVIFDPVTDRSKRASIHQEIRRIFKSRFDTGADANGVIKATPTKWATSNRATSQNWGRPRDNSRRDQNRQLNELGGPYLHFTLYKENKDTMDAVNTIARLLKIKASNFGFAGTKDRRASTVQRISVFGQQAKNLIWINSRITSVKVGQFEHRKEPLELGQHGGNEFVITLKNCQPLGGNNCSLAHRMKMIQQSVECGLAYLKHNGYINYFGLQRFGTYAIGTHLLGMKILKGDYEGFIDDVLYIDDETLKDVLSNTQPQYQPGKDLQQSRDDQDRARAITTWKTTKNAAKALQIMPKRFSSETAIIRHLGKNPKDFKGACLSITRGLRSMYTHAYQSYVWNFVATRRWSKYGAKVVEGDLVLVEGSRRRDRTPDEEYNPYDDNDDDNIYAQARTLTAEDVASGKYTIHDIVLPTPGYDVVYPGNDIGQYYIEFMGKPENGALDPYNMRRLQREFSLSGNYRPLIGRLIGDPQYAVRAYCDDTEQMYPTDLDYATHKKKAEKLENVKAHFERNHAAEIAAHPGAKPSARPDVSPGPDASVNRWAHFSKNPQLYDDAMSAASRRRKAEHEPSSDGVIVTNETWAQTGVDGSGKRVRLTNHHQQVETQASSDPIPSASPAVPAVKVDEPEEDGGYPRFPVGNGAPLHGHTPENSPRKDSARSPQDSSRIIGGGPVSMMPFPGGTVVPIPGLRGISDQYYAATGMVPYFGALPAGFNTAAPVNGFLGLSNLPTLPTNTAGVPVNDIASKAEPETTDPMNWYGPNMPKVSAASTSATDAQANHSSTALVKVEEPSNASSDTIDFINGIPLPKLRTASDNPLSSPGNGIDEANINPLACKIAVILKFQLKPSNYATIVLRELMGTTAEELAL